jgi:outer membrane protein TolC
MLRSALPLLVSLVAGALPLAAQQSLPARGLRLEEAVMAALQRSPEVLNSRHQMSGSWGAARGAAGVFDPQVRTFAESGRDQLLRPGQSDTSAYLRQVTNTVRYGVSLDKQFRSGITLQPQLSVTRIDVAPVPGVASNRAAVGVDLTVPVLRGRGGGLAAAGEGAARESFRAATEDGRHAQARVAQQAMGAYWDYLAAFQRLGVYREAESRAQLLVDETRRLVAADERPASDLAQLTANVATKRATRINAEQALVEARQRLGSAMAVSPEESAALQAPATHFPDPAVLSPAELQGVTGALERRADLAAARVRTRAAGINSAAARRELRPRLDLRVGVGYSGSTPGGGMGELVSPLYDNVAGLNTSLHVSYQVAARNGAAVGRWLQSQAAGEQNAVAAEQLARDIASTARVALDAVASARRELAEYDQAVRLSAQAVEGEKNKFRLGGSTLFDALYAEDAMIAARIGRIGGEQRYSAALVRLHFAAGVLVQEGAEPAVDSARLVVTVPAPR